MWWPPKYPTGIVASETFGAESVDVSRATKSVIGAIGANISRLAGCYVDFEDVVIALGEAAELRRI